MSQLQLDLLGPPRMTFGKDPLQLSSRKPLALLAYLAVGGQAFSRDTLAALFWPEQDQSTARAYLRNALWVLGRAGLEECFEPGPETLGLRAGYRLDTTEFRRLVDEGFRQGQAASLRAAADLYRGDFLAGFTLRDSPEFDDWQSYQAESLRQELGRVLERLVEHSASASDWEEGIRYGRRWVTLDPLHEPAQRWLMRLYSLGGKRSQALKQYELLARHLDHELGFRAGGREPPVI